MFGLQLSPEVDIDPVYTIDKDRSSLDLIQKVGICSVYTIVQKVNIYSFYMESKCKYMFGYH